MNLPIPSSWRSRNRNVSCLARLEQAPELVRQLCLHGSSWETEDHSFERCRELLPHCKRLIEFRIGWLNWRELPLELGTLPTLESVVSLNATIQDFPYFLKDCPRLKRLAIRGGDIRAVDNRVLGFAALRDLDLANNPLTEIPDDLERQLGLNCLQLHDTPLLLASRGLTWSRYDYPGITANLEPSDTAHDGQI